MRIGESHRDIAILLVGALSRWVNQLEDDEIQKPQTKNILKALRMFSFLSFSIYPFNRMSSRTASTS